jgi:ATP-binding cassette subfamily B protein RaxB
MLLRSRGIDVSLQQIRQTHDVSIRGSSLRDLLTVLADYGLVARPMRAELDRLPDVSLPAILHWSFDHFVVLERCRGNVFEIVDPACGRRQVTRDELDQKFTGIAVEPVDLVAPVAVADGSLRLRLRDLLPSFRTLAPMLALIFLTTVIFNIGALVLPLMVKASLDRVTKGGIDGLFSALAAAFLVLAILQGINRFVRGMGLVTLRRTLSQHMARSVFSRLLWLNGSVVERRSAGNIASNFRSIFALSDTLGEDVLSALIDAIATVAVLAILFVYDLEIGFAALASIAAFSVWTIMGNSGAKIRMGQVLAHEGREGGFFVETVTRLQAIRLFQAERWRDASFATVHERLEDVREDYAQWLNRNRSVGEALLQAAWVLVVAMATWRVAGGTMSIGLFSAIVVWLGLATTRARDAVTRIAQLDWLESHVDRLADILLGQSDRSATSIPVLGPTPQSIGCEGLSVRYAPSLPLVLEDVSFEVLRGQWVTIIGASGEGKSTLVKAITGLLGPQEGALRLDGRAVDWQAVERLRRHVGAVMQNDGLFAGSLRDNITLFSEVPDITFMEECADIAGIADDISRMPMKYDSLVGEQGAGLSAGQGQRLMLARALYKKPEFLVLDEFTANIDEESEDRIIRRLKALGLGVLAIAHRNRVIAAADRVYELQGGKLTLQKPQSLQLASAIGEHVPPPLSASA